MSNPTPTLVVIRVNESGPCGICGLRKTTTWCTSCMPQHYLCNGCFDSHKISVQSEQEAEKE